MTKELQYPTKTLTVIRTQPAAALIGRSQKLSENKQQRHITSNVLISSFVLTFISSLLFVIVGDILLFFFYYFTDIFWLYVKHVLTYVSQS